jgi:hypothetical protein
MNNKTYLSGILLLGLVALLLMAGCEKQETQEKVSTETPETADDFDNITGIQGSPNEIVEKRGQMTNITDLEELKLRASKIQSFRYVLVDSDESYQYGVLGKGRFFRMDLPVAFTSEIGDPFDMIMLERTTKTALAKCSEERCKVKDVELEKVDYAEFYKTDMLEHLSALFDGRYVGEEMIGDNVVKVFDVKYLTRPGRAWIQEYWGFPLKIEYQKEDGSTRTLEFKNITIDDVRIGEIQLPFNCTVKGQSNHWWNWEHYLGEYPENQKLALGPDGEPQYRA